MTCDCLIFMSNPKDSGMFYNVQCSTSAHFSTSAYSSICETDLEYSICPPEKCPLGDPGYFMVHGKCFYLETKKDKNFKDAKANCKCKGGKLYEPKDIAEMEEVLKNSGPGAWAMLGITDIASEGNWAYDSNNQNINFSLDYVTNYKATGTSHNCMVIHTQHTHPEFKNILNIPCSSSGFRSICEL